LGDLFDGQRPVLVTLNYADCPMLCSLELSGLVAGLKEIELTAGKDFEIVTVSIDATATPEKIARWKDRYVKDYGRPEAAAGWRFLAGDEASIHALAEAVGFRYRWIEERKEFAHAAAIAVASPEGRVVRYLYGIAFPRTTLRLSLVEAAEGKIGTPLDQALLFCFHYDAAEGKYGPAAMNIMRAGGALTVLALGLTLGRRWARDWKRKSREAGRTL
ncbi:MAG: SCO family protein, partial [Candidatus Methylomirabilis sp.]|nr:SCO family protein [Deltaproteobacteria bacterium]